MKKTYSTSILLLLSLGLITGCSAQSETDATISPSPTLSESPNARPAPSESAPTDISGKSEAEALLSLISDNIDEKVLAELDSVVQASIAQADSLGLIEINATSGQDSEYKTYLPAGINIGVGFVIPESGLPDPESVSNIEKDFFNLYGISQVIEMKLYTGINKNDAGEILISIDPRTDANSIKFIYVVAISEQGLVNSITNTGTYRDNAPVIVSSVSFGSDQMGDEVISAIN